MDSFQASPRDRKRNRLGSVIRSGCPCFPCLNVFSYCSDSTQIYEYHTVFEAGKKIGISDEIISIDVTDDVVAQLQPVCHFQF